MRKLALNSGFSPINNCTEYSSKKTNSLKASLDPPVHHRPTVNINSKHCTGSFCLQVAVVNILTSHVHRFLRTELHQGSLSQSHEGIGVTPDQ